MMLSYYFKSVIINKRPLDTSVAAKSFVASCVLRNIPKGLDYVLLNWIPNLSTVENKEGTWAQKSLKSSQGK